MQPGDTIISLVIDLTLLTAIAVAVYTDLKWGKIYNKITLPLIGAGLLLNFMHNGASGLLFSLGGLSAGLIFGMLLFSLRMMGGGDLKLAMGIGALKGYYFFTWMGLYTFMLGGIVSAVWLARNGGLVRTLSGFAGILFFRAPLNSAVNDKYERMPYSPMIAAGVMLALVHIAFHQM